jgi:biotin carboxyl carrier protein
VTHEVVVAGRTRMVDVVPIASGWSVILDGRSYEVALEPQPDGTTLYVNGQRVSVTTRHGAARFAAGRSGGARTNGPMRVLAPMPGRIVKVLVKPGDRVEPRQPLIVVEAMKMENELRASGAGTVAEVKVAQGASVDANAVLMVIMQAGS